MRKPKMFGIRSLIFLLLLGLVMAADGTFEDADKSKDYTSGNMNQQFDLRHTIPGEPEVDYPIYSEVPKTSFECSGRHEGYYADVESRCQAFRICAHTARNVHGFGFLCPNGTLFSQKNFVCDWYRNVNCDESEQYYSKNDVNRIGSSYDMLERVRQIMEYPMKTISKALQRGGSAAARRPATTPPARRTLKKELHGATAETADQYTVSSRGRNSQRGSARKQAVTRAQVESVKSYSHKDDTASASTQPQQDTARATNADVGNIEFRFDGEQTTKTATVGETAVSQTGAGDSDPERDDVYVNSLGELSSDPGVIFDRTNAHIIAESPRSNNYGKKLNFAEKVNAALNDLVDLPPTGGDVLAPDYVKNMRKSTNEATQTDLASNINGLLDEIAYELDTNVAGYPVATPQNTKHAFKFLSRGFSSQSERAKDPPYLYGKPKQTASTIRFSPNELPIDDKEAKTQKHTDTSDTNANANANTNTNIDIDANAHAFEKSEETIRFTIMTTTTTEPAPADETSVAAIDDSYLSAATLPPLDDYSYLSPPLLDALLPPTTDAIDATEVSPYDPAAHSTVETTESPVFAAYVGTTNTPPPPSYEESVTTLATPSDKLTAVTDDAEEGDDLNVLADLKEQQRDVARHAAQLLLAGVKLTTLDNRTENVAFAEDVDQRSAGELLIRVEDEPLSTPAADTSTAYAPPTTVTPAPLPAGSITEGSSFSERIRNYRRFATLQRATARPLVYTKRTQMHTNVKSATTKPPSSTTASTTTTRSYLKRVAASRLRLSRLAAASRGINVAPTTENINNSGNNNINNNSNNEQSSESGRKISVRNIDKELGGGKGYDSRPNAFDSDASRNGVATWESVANNLKRYQVNRKPGLVPHTTTAPIATTRTTTRNVLLRSRNRFANFKSQHSGKEPLSDSTSTTSTTPAAPPAPPQQTLQQQLTQTVSYNSPLSSSLSNSSTYNNQNNNNQNDFNPLNSVPTSVSYSTSTSASSSPKNPPSTPSIPKALTNAASPSISSASSDSTFLSFDKLTRAIVDDSVLQNFKGSYRPSTSSTYQSVAAITPQRSVASFGNAVAPSVRPTANPVALDFGRIPAQAPSQLTAPQRPLVLPQVQTTPNAKTAATPRVLIARAEGQRIEPDSVSSIISALVTQKPRATQATPYVPLDDFLTKKFGGSMTAQSYQKSTASTFLAQQQQQQYHQYQQKQFPKMTKTFLTQKTPQQQQQVETTAATYQTSKQLTQQHYQKATATVPTVLAQQPQQQQYQQQHHHHHQNQQSQQQLKQQQYHQQHKHQQQHFQQEQKQQHRHQKYKQQQYQQVATTATTLLAQQLQQHQLRLQQQYQQQQYQQQQSKQQQLFQQQQQYPKIATTAPTSLTQQQQYTQPQQQYSQQQLQAVGQQQPTYYQTSTTTAKQQPQLPYLPPLQQDKQMQQQQQLQTQTPAAKFSYSQQQQQYEPQQQQSPPQQQHSQSMPDIFATLQQQQQQQLPEFPPLALSAAPISPTAATLSQPTPSDLPPEHDVHLNVQLPALPNGLIPAPTTLTQTQSLQKRIDTATSTEYTQPSAASTESTPAENSVYSGVSSYEVPLSSIGRLPNDITQLLRRLRKH